MSRSRIIKNIEASIALKETDEGRSQILMDSVVNLYDEIHEAARDRNSIIADREQIGTLVASLSAIRDRNFDQAALILEERLKKLIRRIGLREADEEEDKEDFCETITPKIPPNQASKTPFDLNLCPDAWVELCGHELNISDELPTEGAFDGGSSTPSALEESALLRQKAALQESGFLLGDPFECAAALSTPIHKVDLP